MKYNHLTIEERETIQEMLWQKCSIREIAIKLNRNPSSVSREIKRYNPQQKMRYTPRLSHERAVRRRSSRGRKDRLKSKEIREYVISKLKIRWSPEQIAGSIKQDIGKTISHEAIYQFIYYQVHRDGYGYLKPDCIDLRNCLRRRHRRRQPNGMRKSQKLPRFNGISIEQRPEIVDLRERIGDWETDSVESSISIPGVNTLLERMSGLYLVTKLKDKGSLETKEAIVRRLNSLPVHTITLDNGSENALWMDIEKELNAKTYYCHAYCSGERGSNENTNGLLRDFFPKGTDFTTISESEILYVEYLINTRPRKRLGWKTPLQVFNESVALQS